MRLVACNWHKPGDEAAPPGDPWYARPFELPLYVPLATYVKTHPTANAQWNFDEALAAGDSTVIARELQAVELDLAAIEAGKADKCLPYSVPRVLGVQPVPNPVCLAAIAAARKGADKLIPRPFPNPFAIPDWALWAAVIYALSQLPE